MEPSTSGMSSNTIYMRRQELYNVLKSSGQTEISEQFVFLREYIRKRTGCQEADIKDLNRRLSHFKSQLKDRWSDANRMEDRFSKQNRTWLDSSISFTRYFKTSTAKQRGRPTMDFEESSDRTKRQKTEELRKSTPLLELTYATQMSLRASGQTEASKLVREITSTPKRAGKYRKAYGASIESQPRRMSGEDALALLVDAKLSRHQYNLIRISDPHKFPSYKVVQTAKKQCYPKREHMVITSTSAEVRLQAVLDHTVERLSIVQESVLATINDKELKTLCLITKWGFDGSSGHSSYKQAFYGSEDSDSSVFITSLVPLRLTFNSDNTDSKIIWQNPRPSSTRYCRPLKIEFIKESTQVSVKEKNRVFQEIENLSNSTFTLNGRTVSVSHKLIFAMIDGKVCNALTETSSTQKCYICGATSKDFNSIGEMIKKKVNTENLQFGISVLHGWIRFFETLLHLAYKLPIKKWQARGRDKEVVAETKKGIQKEFRERTGLIVDNPKPGFGNSNDGNTARRFFADPDISAQITKIDIDLIKKMHIILVVVSCGHEINVDKFREFAHNTAQYFVEKYPWYCMPPTVHKFLIHGPEIISAALLPIGQLTEEAQEARNKDFKKYREHYSRKCSREKSNEDIFNLFLLSSDPLITSKRKLPKKKLQCLPIEALDLLAAPTVEPQRQGDNNDDEAEDSLQSDSDDAQ